MMRFEFDDNGYVSCILYGCYTGSCCEYSGLVPSEPEAYEDMDDWANRAQVQAYYLNDQGNLVYDAERAATIPAEDERPRYTSEQLQELGILDVIYPVGSIYMSVNNVSPETLFGGTWEQIEDKFILAAGSTYSAGDEGGAASYALSVAHKHTAPIGYNSDAVGSININGTVSTGSGKAYRTANTDYSGSALSSNVTALYTSNATVSATIPTLPPYLSVYIWKRTA